MTSEAQRKGWEQLHTIYWWCAATGGTAREQNAATVGQLRLYCTIISNVGRLGIKQQSTRQGQNYCILYKNHFREEL